MSVGSAAYLVSKPIKEAKVLTFADLGMEAIYQFRAKNTPVTVALDRYPCALRNASIVSARSGNALSTPLSAVTSRTDSASASATNSAS